MLSTIQNLINVHYLMAAIALAVLFALILLRSMIYSRPEKQLSRKRLGDFILIYVDNSSPSVKFFTSREEAEAWAFKFLTRNQEKTGYWLDALIKGRVLNGYENSIWKLGDGA